MYLNPGFDDDVLNLASKSRKIGGKFYSDRRVAVFGNSEMSKPGDWVQVSISRRLIQKSFNKTVQIFGTFPVKLVALGHVLKCPDPICDVIKDSPRRGCLQEHGHLVARGDCLRQCRIFCQPPGIESDFLDCLKLVYCQFIMLVV